MINVNFTISQRLHLGYLFSRGGNAGLVVGNGNPFSERTINWLNENGFVVWSQCNFNMNTRNVSLTPIGLQTCISLIKIPPDRQFTFSAFIAHEKLEWKIYLEGSNDLEYLRSKYWFIFQVVITEWKEYSLFPFSEARAAGIWEGEIDLKRFENKKL